MGKQKQRRTPEEIAQIRAARAARKADATDPVDAASLGAMSLSFRGGAFNVTIEEDWHPEDADPIAGLQWAGGMRLARLFDDEDVFPDEFWSDATVLELGAGHGLTSLVIAARGARKVCCTDADVTHAKRTVARPASKLAWLSLRVAWSGRCPLSLHVAVGAGVVPFLCASRGAGVVPFLCASRGAGVVPTAWSKFESTTT